MGNVLVSDHADRIGPRCAIWARITLLTTAANRTSTSPRANGLDHIIEIGGAETFAKSLRVIKPSGVISMIGILGGPLPTLELARVVTRNVRLQGVTVGSRDMLADLCRALHANAIHPVIDDASFAFDQVGSALDALASGAHFGKVICTF